MRIKINKTGTDWNAIREAVVWILFLVILTLGAFGWGYIYRDRRIDNLEGRVTRIDDRQKDMSGRLIAIEGKKKQGQ